MQRGVAYSLARESSAGTEAALVLSNDQWSDAMNSVAVVPLKRPFADPSPLTPLIGELQADAGRLVNVPKDELATATLTATDDELRNVENAVCDVLDLERLTGSNPRAPRPTPGPIDYAHWSEIYWITGRSAGGENKRYLVVSHDAWNQEAKTPIVVRTTTSPRRRTSDEFPEILDGGALAVCGEVTSVPGSAVATRDRPTPHRAPLSDMVSVAHGIVHVLDLHDALGISP